MKKKLLSSFGYTIFSAILGFGFSFVIARLLGAKAYGEIIYYLSFIGLLSLIIGINYIGLYMGSKITKGDKNTFSLFFTIESLFFLIIAIPAYFVVLHYVQDIAKSILILIASYLVTIVQVSALEYNSQQDVSGSIVIGSFLPKLFLIIPFVVLVSMGIKSSLYYLYLLLFANSMIVGYVLYKFRPIFYVQVSIFTRVWKFYLLGIIGEGFMYISQILQKEYGSYETLASLAIAILFFTGLGLPDSVLVKFILPKIHEYFRYNKIEKIGQLYTNNTQLSFMINSPILIWLILNISDISKMLGDGYIMLPTLFYILSVGYGADLMTGIAGHILRATENEKYEIYNEIVRAIVGLSVIYFLKDNLYGIAIAIAISLFVYNLLKYGEIYCLYGFKPVIFNWHNLLYVAIIINAFKMVSLIVNIELRILIDTLIFGLIYAGVFYHIKQHKYLLEGYR